MKKYLKNIIYGYYYFRIIYAISPKWGANIIFKRFFNRNINWKNPKNLQEKTYWLLYNTPTKLWTDCADKYKVREYLKSRNCSDILVDLYGHWKNPNDIDFSSLPDKFVLKANNGCGSIIVVKDKSQLDKEDVRKQLKQWMKYPFGYNGSQKHYLEIEPCIIAEEYLEEQDVYAELSPASLVDYKIWCFNGIPECILVVFNRTKTNAEQAVYDINWNNISSKVFKASYYKPDLPKPKNLDKMLEYASVLSKNIPEVRIDLYNINGNIYFGEMTFTAGYGDLTDEYYDYLGSKVNINL